MITDHSVDDPERRILETRQNRSRDTVLEPPRVLDQKMTRLIETREKPVRRRMAADDRRAQIISVAAKAFEKSGFSQTSMDDIAAAAGIAKPTLYHYFESKNDLLHSIHEEFIDILIARQDARRDTGLRPDQLLLEAMADVLEIIETHRGHVRVFFENHRELPRDARAKMRVKRDSYEKTIEDLFVEGIRSGDFRDLNPKLATLAMFGMCNWAYQWHSPGSQPRPRELAYQFWNILVFGVGAGAGREA
jgi:AcrR family transcriptional regulator